MKRFKVEMELKRKLHSGRKARRPKKISECKAQLINLSGDETNLLNAAQQELTQKFLVNISKTSQELRMLSIVNLNCHGTKIVMNSGSQLSEL